MCEVYILCHHPVEDYAIADHRDPTQWEFFVLPVVARSKAVSETELAALRKRLSSVGRAASTQRRPETLKRGIRGREPIVPVGIHELTTNAVWEAVARFG